MSRPVSCTGRGWNVSYQTGTDLPGGRARLSVFRVISHAPWVVRRGDQDGRVFPSADAASAFALDRGYTVPYFHSSRGTFKRVHRVALRAIMARAWADVAAAEGPCEVVEISNRVGREVRALAGDDVLMPLAWQNGVFAYSRRFLRLLPADAPEWMRRRAA